MRLVRQRTTDPSRLSEAGPSANAEEPTLLLGQASTNPVAPLPSPTSTEHLQGPTILITISDDDSSEDESVESHSETSAVYEELMTTEILTALEVQEVNEVGPHPLGDHVPDIDPTARKDSVCTEEVAANAEGPIGETVAPEMENDTDGGGAPQVSRINETTVEAEGSVLESAPLSHGEPRVEFPDSPVAEGTYQPVEDEETEEAVHPFALVVRDPVALPPPPPPTRFERLMRVLEVTPPSAVDEAKMVLHEHLGPRVLETDILPRVLEALRYLRQEKALTLQQFSAIDDLLNELGEARQLQPAANAQAHDTREALNSLSREMDISRGILNERTNHL
ncbi:uncharacterized protein LOC133707215 [Rosa rugosa]|uniref:uncharacterized protein LOC133707215 n=1 Tax=Rosa rugosa TaxID=74645 RepID=UPI002B409815|nr:uncharacterized protein LOC133707215 [Rosa rugosa]